MGDMLNRKVSAPKNLSTKIIGATTINHAARVDLGLNCSEYVLMNYISRCLKNNTDLTIGDTYRNTGFQQEEMQMLLNSLVRKGFILPINSPRPTITDKWDSAFTNLETEFEDKFWNIKDPSGVNRWTGSSKKQALLQYLRTRKDVPADIIITSANEYFTYLDWVRKNGFNRATMGAEKFLNEKNEYYKVDWNVMTEQEKQKYYLLHPEEKETESNKEILTAQSRKEFYEQDNHK